MPIPSIIDQLSPQYVGDIHQDKSLLDKEVNKLFNTNYHFNEEDYTHMYASLASNSKVCVPIKAECTLATENGHDRIKGLVTYFRILLDIAVKETRGPSNLSAQNLEKIYQEINRTIQTIKLIQHRQNNYPHVHLAYLMQAIRDLPPNAVLRYHAGFIGHTLYLNIRRNGMGVKITVNNLGDGFKQGHCYTPRADGSYLVQTRTLMFSTINTAAAYLAQVASCAQLPDATAALNALYPAYNTEQQNFDIQNGITEISQTTGNCVIKNMLCAVKEKFKDDAAYNIFYKLLIERTLNYKAYYAELHELPASSDVCNSVLNSQLSFLLESTPLNPCAAVADGIQICKSKEREEIDVPTLLFSMLIGAVAGAGIGAAASNKEKGASAALGGLIGAFGGGIIATEKVAIKKIREPAVCQPLASVSSHCYSCP